ncbi:MAG: TerC family protein [Bacillota bacterium]
MVNGTIGSPVLWVGFTGLVLALILLDLGVFHRKAHAMSYREALRMSVWWIALALAFNAGVYVAFGRQPALEFLAGYLIEKALSVDNLFVFLVIFSLFGVPAMYQHRVLYWGIVGAIAMRAAFILVGAALLSRFHWMVFVFGGFLVLTGIKMLLHRNAEPRPERNVLFRLFRRFVPAVSEYHGARFTVRQGGRRFATPLLLVLVLIEATDLVFAVDSIPAIFAVTRDPFIVYTSNIFAILGLRALYFLLAGLMDRFRYLKVGLSFVLVFVGIKMLVSDLYKVPIGVSLAVIAILLGASVVASLRYPPAAATRMRREGAAGLS